MSMDNLNQVQQEQEPAEMENNMHSEQEGEPAVVSKDAQVSLFFDEGHMTAEMLVEPPLGEGRHITVEKMRAELEKAGVVYGLDREALIALEAPLYNERMVVARGTPAVNGKDGYCTELFTREAAKSHVERADGSVDYKQLGLLRDLDAGTVIIEITPPTAGEEGTNTLGQPVKAIEGAKAVPPIGEHIKLSDDGLRCVTEIKGNLVWRSERFTVETVYRVQTVDYDVGNIKFSGDVHVLGDMLDGFEIDAGGTVTLDGNGGAVVIKARDIMIGTGINGTGKAVLEGSGTIKAGFIENCTILAGEKLIANSVINCKVECEGEVDVTGGKGIICGGKVTSLGSVKAKVIGNESNTLTVVTVGVTPRMLRERKHMEDQISDVEKHVAEHRKNLEYIEKLVSDGRKIPDERVALLKRTQIQLPMSERKLEQLRKNLAELEARIADTAGVSVVGGTIHPPTKISIGTQNASVAEKRSRCRVYKAEDGLIVFGSA